ncbi:hypothetical protein M9458_053390 [Cirrhinus mrigala]|uniref:Uncharacterized protein n=1 Tax=Cirrhinus mrigala TaxID=683832 RepID=A0ABD0MM82_CIRMR
MALSEWPPVSSGSRILGFHQLLLCHSSHLPVHLSTLKEQSSISLGGGLYKDASDKDALSPVHFWVWSLPGTRRRCMTSSPGRGQHLSQPETALVAHPPSPPSIYGYTGVPPVEHEVVMQLCPNAISTWGKALKDLHKGGHNPEVLWELCTATDLTLRAAKVTAQSLGRAMSTMVVQESYLCLCLADMKETNKIRFLNALVSQTGLFCDAVENVAQQFHEAIRHILPRRTAAASTRPPSSRQHCGAGRKAAAPPVQEALRWVTQRWRKLLFGIWQQWVDEECHQTLYSHTCCQNACASVVLLAPLEPCLGAWLQLPCPSCWLLRPIRLGYAIQFWGVHFTTVKTACRNRNFTGEGCDRAGPSNRYEDGVLQPLHHSTQERQGVTTDLGSADVSKIGMQ